MVVLVLAATVVYPQEESNNSPTDEGELYFSEADGAPVEMETDAPAAFGMGDLIRMVVVLVGVVAAIYGLVALLKRFGSSPQSDDDTIRILASRTLIGSKAVHAIQIGTQVFLVGTGDNDVGLIAMIDDRETIQQLELNYSSRETERVPFAARLAAVFSRDSEPTTGGGLSVLRNQRERLRGLGQ